MAKVKAKADTKVNNSAEYEISATDIILEAITKYGGKQKQGTTYKLVLCPFHEEDHPSLSINISKPGLAVGTYHCWSCDASGGWNKFANKVGLPQVKKWQRANERQVYGLTEEEEHDLLGSTMSYKELETKLSCDVIRDWKDDKAWRGFSGRLLRKLDCKLVTDKRTDEIMLLFPVHVNTELVGGIKAILEKTNKSQLAYITSKGSWVKDKGLFPFDYVSKLINRRKLRFVVLVEGPRDALRLISVGIPAIAILGANNFSRKKAISLLSIGDLEFVFSMPDNDEGGDKCHSVIKEAFKGLCSVKRIKLPKDRDENGKIIKIDPMSASKKLIRQLKQAFRDAKLLPKKRKRT